MVVVVSRSWKGSSELTSEKREQKIENCEGSDRMGCDTMEWDKIG